MPKQEKQKEKRFGRITRIDRAVRMSQPVRVQMSDAKTGRNLGWQNAIPDTGAEASVGSLELLRRIGVSRESLQPTTSRMVAFNGTNDRCLGVLAVTMENESYKTDVEVNIFPHVTDDLLLSFQACKDLGYIPKDFPAVIPPSRGRSPHGATGGRAPVKIPSVKMCGRLLIHTPKLETKRDLPRLKPGQGVRAFDKKTKRWNTVGAIVRAESKQRSYLVKVGKEVYVWRNRRHLRPFGSGVTELGKLPSTRPPTPSTRGRWRSGEEKSVTFLLPDTGGTTSTATAPRRSQQMN